ncbi:aspartate/glutamate racemase family protein [Micromonospora sp. NPDC002296]|uniref:aspartate/glutamate racemase family protein n=1 Tax=Micromonospora sp. NPDC002296 TaxID=3154271 RepID=UPI0033186015
MTAAPIGVLWLGTTFEKIPGHIRNPDTFDFPVVYRRIDGATPQRLVRDADPTLLEPIITAAKDLEAAGVAGITGACGFLVLFQAELAAAVSVPVWASSLIQLPMVHRMVGQPVGLLVADEFALTPRHLAAIGAESVPVRVTGMADQPEFREVMMEGRRDALDVGRLEREVLDRVDRLAEANPDLGALVIECTDLVPFAHTIQARLGLPVFDIVTLTTMAHATLTRRPFRARP